MREIRTYIPLYIANVSCGKYDFRLQLSTTVVVVVVLVAPVQSQHGSSYCQRRRFRANSAEFYFQLFVLCLPKVKARDEKRLKLSKSSNPESCFDPWSKAWSALQQLSIIDSQFTRILIHENIFVIPGSHWNLIFTFGIWFSFHCCNFCRMLHSTFNNTPIHIVCIFN